MDAIQRVRDAADATIAAGSARLSMTSSLATAPPMSVQGTIDFANRRSWARLTMPSAPDGEQDGTIEVETVIVGPDFYVQVIELPGRWLWTRLEEHDDDMPAGDPGLLLDWLRGCTQAARTDSVGAAAAGAGLTAFDVVFDLNRAVEAAPEGSRRAVRTWIDQIAPDGQPRAARVWLDSDDRLHRLTILDPAAELDAQLSGHGKPVEIAVPDDTAVIEPADLHDLLPDLPTDLPQPPPSEWDNE